LAHPSPDETEQLARIAAILPRKTWLRHGLLLPGHQPNDTVARWVAAARFGMPGLNAPGGVYVCGSIKEEFGIAILEAMGAGLMVVAPTGGGPATYVDNGYTGILTATNDARQLGAAMAKALATVAHETTPERAQHARDVVEEDFTIQAMAATLADIYSMVDGAAAAFDASRIDVR
jgi:glycosyltransferase involved in cell wall biosynthesis